MHVFLVMETPQFAKSSSFCVSMRIVRKSHALEFRILPYITNYS